MLLITGSHGLVGAALRAALTTAGVECRGLDLAAPPPDRGDTRQKADVRRAVTGVEGVVHLAAVSRVIWGERDPEACRATNVEGTRNVLEACAAQPQPPWVLFASSREVYGQPEVLPATEDAPLRPVNLYGRTKVQGEELTLAARARGLRTAVVRLANVYGAAQDHPDRVVPAFARAAIAGTPLRVDGPGHTFDFTHLDDVTRGLMRLIGLLQQGRQDLPPVHLLPGVPVTLGELAQLAVELAGTAAPICPAPPRSYDVARFYGDPARAAALLGGWQAQVPLREGLARLITDLRQVHP